MLPVAGFLNLCLLYCKAFPDKELRMTSSFPNRTLGQSVLVSAAQYASRPAVVTEVGTLTYEHLARLIDAFATNLAVRGVDSSSFCAVAGADPMITLMSYFAASALGARWTTGISDDEIARQVGVTHVILPETIEASVSVGHRIDVDQTWSARPPQFGVGSDIPFAETTGLDDDWVIAPTSGTTGNSKLVAISQRAMLKRAQALSGHFGEPECLLGSLMPVTSFPFLSRILPVFLAGGCIVVAQNGRFIIESRPTDLFGSPNQFSSLMAQTSNSERLGTAHVGGGKLSDDLALGLLGRFETVFEHYGSTEANMVYSVRKSLAADGTVQSEYLGCEGEVQIVDEAGQPTPDGELGELRIRHDYLANDYLNAPDARESAFREGWFHPGDLGHFLPDGRLEIVGRTRDTLNVGGVKLPGPAIDAALRDITDVVDAMCFLLPDSSGISRIAAFLVVRGKRSQNAVAEDARAELSDRFGPRAAPEKVLFAPSLPRGATGEPDREKCAFMAVSKRQQLLN